MDKKAILKKQAEDLNKKIKKIEIREQQKIGKLVLTMYHKNKLNNTYLNEEIAKIIGQCNLAKEVNQDNDLLEATI